MLGMILAASHAGAAGTNRRCVHGSWGSQNEFDSYSVCDDWMPYMWVSSSLYGPDSTNLLSQVNASCNPIFGPCTGVNAHKWYSLGSYGTYQIAGSHFGTYPPLFEPPTYAYASLGWFYYTIWS